MTSFDPKKYLTLFEFSARCRHDYLEFIQLIRLRFSKCSWKRQQILLGIIAPLEFEAANRPLFEKAYDVIFKDPTKKITSRWMVADLAQEIWEQEYEQKYRVTRKDGDFKAKM